ncbi:hypothetical protein LLH00_05910 [bacterium]|nr:hypothetical protein [bacterium]
MRYAVAVFALALLCGCVSAQVTMLGGNQKLAAIAPEQVQVFMSPNDISVPYDKVAVIHAQGGSGFTTEQGMIKKAQKEAAKIGANGIIVETIKEPSSGAKVAGAIFGIQPERRGQITAIRLKEKPADPK